VIDRRSRSDGRHQKTKSANAADCVDRKRGFSTASTPELSRVRQHVGSDD
jgi:hypothetical protein